MQEWWVRPVNPEPVPGVDVMACRLLSGLLLGLAVAGVHRLCVTGPRNQSGTLSTTLVLLSVILALVTVVIGDNAARAFGLVGALSIVRFRTVVEDTRDTAFVIFAVVVGMAAGAGYAIFATVGVPFVVLATVLLRWANPSVACESATLTLRVGFSSDPAKPFRDVLSRQLLDARLVGVATARRGQAMDLTYSGRLREADAGPALIAELKQVEGVQSVELRWG